MKIIPMKVEFAYDMYQMINYLYDSQKLVPYHHANLESVVGGFKLGRATGHSTYLKSVATELVADGKSVCIVTMQSQVREMATQSVKVVSYSELEKLRYVGLPDVFILDCYSLANSNRFRYDIDEFMAITFIKACDKKHKIVYYQVQ